MRNHRRFALPLCVGLGLWNAFVALKDVHHIEWLRHIWAGLFFALAERVWKR